MLMCCTIRQHSLRLAMYESASRRNLTGARISVCHNFKSLSLTETMAFPWQIMACLSLPLVGSKLPRHWSRFKIRRRLVPWTEQESARVAVVVWEETVSGGEVRQKIQKLPEIQEVSYRSRIRDIKERAKPNPAKLAGA